MAEPIEVKFKIDPESYKKLVDLNKRLGTPNIATAIYSAVQILSRLMDYEAQGYKVATLDREGRAQSLPMPKSATTAYAVEN